MVNSRANFEPVFALLKGCKDALDHWEIGISHTSKVFRSHLLSARTPKNQALIELLVREEETYLKERGQAQQMDVRDFRLCHVRASRTEELVKGLAAAGCLHQQKPLYFHLATRARLVLTLDKLSLTKHIELRGQPPMPAAEGLLCLGSPSAFIYKQFLYLLPQDLSPKWLKLPDTVTERQARELIEDLQDETDPSYPTLICQQAPTATPLPTPTVKLLDLFGTTVTLHVTYVEGARKNPDAEKAFRKDLIEAGYGDMGQLFTISSSQAFSALNLLLEIGWAGFDKEGRKLVLASLGNLVVTQNTDFEVSTDGTLPFETAVQAARKSQSLVPLNEKETLLCDVQKIKRLLGPLLEYPLVAGKIRVPAPERGLIPEALLPKQALQVETSARFLGILRPYQQEGLAFLQDNFRTGLGALLADEMGLGKTVQVLAFLASMKTSKPSLVVVPRSLVFNWIQEAAKFCPSLRVSSQPGPGCELIVTTYALARQDTTLAKMDFACVICDEAQNIKNPKSQTAQAIRALRADFRLSITGTPIENSHDDLVAQFAFLIPRLDLSAYSREKIRPFILRRLKRDVAKDLPAKIEQTIFCEQEADEASRYAAYNQAHAAKLLVKIAAEGLGKVRMQAFEVLLRLRQLAAYSPLLAPESVSSKFERVCEDVTELLAEGKKVVLFSQFLGVLDAFETRFASSLRLDGSSQDREGSVRTFQDATGASLFLISLKAGGVGLNLTSADCVILYDPWWNPAVENQAIDRAHRIGRTEPILALRYVTRNTIEEKMEALKAAKRKLADELFIEDEGGLPDEDILTLLQ